MVILGSFDTNSLAERDLKMLFCAAFVVVSYSRIHPIYFDKLTLHHNW